MSIRIAALGALLLCGAHASAAPTLTLEDAFRHVLASHPELRLHDARRAQLTAARAEADLRPPLALEATLENALGSGALHRFNAAELTLAVGSTLERGDKRAARRALAQARIDGVSAARQVQRLDLLAETARRWLDAAAAAAEIELAAAAVQQRGQAVAIAEGQHRAGAVPRSVSLAAAATLARAELDEARARVEAEAALHYLAALWGERAPQAAPTAAELLQPLPELDAPGALQAALAASPARRELATRERVRETRLQLARSEARGDIDWQLGLRQLREHRDVGLVAGLTIPLGSRGRAAPAIRAAEAALAELALEREALDLALHATLVEAHGRYRLARLTRQRLDADILPRLEAAAEAAAAAWRAGADDYAEWDKLLDEMTEARRQRVAATLAGRRALIEIQRLTGQGALAAAGEAP